MKKFRLALVLAVLLLASGLSLAGHKAVEPPAPPSRWTISTGVTFTSMRADFHANANLPFMLLGTGLGGSGSLYDGGANPAAYLDGTVGLAGTTDATTGTTGFSGGTVTLLQSDQGYSLSQAVFRSAAGTPGGARGDSDEALAAGPYIKAAYLLKESGKFSLSIFGQYSFTTATMKGAPAASASLTRRTFTYDVYAGDNEVEGPAFLPRAGAVFNATTFNNASFGFGDGGGVNIRNALPPSTQASTSGFAAFTPERLSVDHHTFALGVDVARELCSRSRLVVSTGPTLNLFCYDFSTPGILVNNGVASRFAPAQNDRGQSVRFGWLARAGVTVDLGARKLWFLEASGEYHWVGKFGVRTDLGSATVDASSWGVNFGLGRRF